MNTIELKGVYEKFKLYSHKRKSLKGYILDILHGRKNNYQELLALRNINLTIKKGEVVGIIGENGSGKTTLLRLIAGILMPDKGSVNVKGRVSSLLELGAAFHPELTGRENIYLNGAVLGLSKRQIDSKLEEIIKFSELEKFVDSPLKAYSAGMCVRLGFAIAINIDPEILLIDEVLVVGDEAFQRKCLERIKEFKKKGKTIVFVSHNMDIVSRLCERVIFLREGEIIEDGPADEIIGLYMQTVGEKKGIGVIKKGPLDFIFNNGKCILCWNGKMLTKDLGGYTSLKIGNNWYPSTEAEWRIQTQSRNEIVAFGRWINLPVSQEWKISLESNNSSKWDIKMSVDEDIKVANKNVMLMLSDKYAKWLSPFEKGDFPEEFHSGQWENIPLENKTIPCIGVKEISEDSTYMPSVMLDFCEEETKLFPFIMNSDFSIRARVLQAQTMEKEQVIQPGNYHFFSGKICVYDKLNDMHRDLNQIAEKKTLQLEEEKRKETLRLKEERKKKTLQLKRETLRHTIERDDLKLIFKDGKCRIFWQETELTKGFGMYTFIFFSDDMYAPDSAQWNIKKLDKTRMIATGKWPKGRISQIWDISLEEDNYINWKVDLEHDKLTKIDHLQAGVVVLDKYKKWIYSDEEGEFPKILASDRKWVEVARKNPGISGVSGVIGVGEDFNDAGQFLPSIIFDFSGNKSAAVSVVYNTDHATRARVLCSDMIRQTKASSSEKHLFFSGKIFVNKDYKTIYKGPKKYIKCGALKLTFDEGRARLTWRDIELTKGLCIYTSLRSKNMWHDSANHATWEVKRHNDNSMILKGKWKGLPVSQLWRLGFKSEDVMFWEIKIQLAEEVELEREQANIMLREEYKIWSANNNKGAFPEEFNADYGGDWESMWKGSPKTGPITIDSVQNTSIFLPSVSFSCSSQDDTYVANIVNSDKMFNGRLLQCLRINEGEKAKFSPCSYRYFSGTIKIINT